MALRNICSSCSELAPVRQADRVMECSARMQVQSAATSNAIAIRPCEVILAIGMAFSGHSGFQIGANAFSTT
jgi:hypothetical protein